ncbi:MAG: hypothetical protein JSS53_08480 [Proteobacteria bacterium]|nr:hypothetical protein [Pseudomonadota bacterium]
MLSSLEKYESALESERNDFNDKILVPFLSLTDEKQLLHFWICYCSDGVGMTQPVEMWIKKAGERCIDLGYTVLGNQLIKHAIHEANHDKMMVEDTKNLVDIWNKKYESKVTAEDFLSAPLKSSVISYQALHENTIKSDAPYGQIAIEYEIERLSATIGLQVLQHSGKVLGEEILSSLSFLTDHSRIDVAHTEYNKKALSQFLISSPETLDNLIISGKNALKTYGAFVRECYLNSVYLD